MANEIVILGVFVADTAYHAPRQPSMGETLIGSHFSLGPGGKGSNQSVAAANAGGDVHFITRLGDDDFANIAFELWKGCGVTSHVTQHPDSYTGAAYIFIEQGTGNNAIIVSPGAAAQITPDDVDANKSLIQNARVFMTQLEQPVDAARRGLELARAGAATTILNPAPAQPLESEFLALCDYVTPNETEAEQLTGVKVDSIAGAEQAADNFLATGVKAAIITLGEKGAFYKDAEQSLHQPAFKVAPVLETTGAGDAFNGGFAVALAEGMPVADALRFACATASISVTRPGTAPSMPARAEIDSVVAEHN
ncbi:MAG: ribokinase [Hyphomicrobiales bacterium]|nr:ribokinase [Hyphomicrobiales bacterium]